MCNIIIAGSRTFNNYVELKRTCDYILQRIRPEIQNIFSGCADGADKLGEQYALENNIPIKKFPADWDLHKKAAGYIRNRQMAKYATHLVAFWDGKSRGTKNMIDTAKEFNLKIKIVKFTHIPLRPRIERIGL